MDKPATNYVFKVLVVGDYAVGKTCLIRRYVDGLFSSSYRITLGVDFSVKRLQVNDKMAVDVQLWDVAGHERFGTMTHIYYKYAIAAIVCFDLSRYSTLENVKKWRDDINSKVQLPNGKPIPMILFANKSDLPNIVIDEEEMEKFCNENGFFCWRKTSSKTNFNIDSSIRQLVKRILEITKNDGLDTTPTFRKRRTEEGLNVIDADDGRRRRRRDNNNNNNGREENEEGSRCLYCV